MITLFKFPQSDRDRNLTIIVIYLYRLDSLRYIWKLQEFHSIVVDWTEGNMHAYWVD